MSLHATTRRSFLKASTLAASATGTVLNESDVHAHNDFDRPNAVHPRPATIGQPTAGRLLHTFPAASLTTLNLAVA